MLSGCNNTIGYVRIPQRVVHILLRKCFFEMLTVDYGGGGGGGGGWGMPVD